MNKVTAEAKAACTALVDNPRYRKALLERLIAGTAGAMEPLCWYYAKGKPKESVSVEASDSLAALLERTLTRG